MEFTHVTLAFSMPGGFEWIIILVVALLLFGKRLPSIMRSLGSSVSEFKKGTAEITEAAKQGNATVSEAVDVKP